MSADRRSSFFVHLHRVLPSVHRRFALKQPVPPADTFIKPFSIERFRNALTWAFLLSMLFVVMRVLATMGGRQWQLLLPLGFVLMMLVPWLLLTNRYRRRIGLPGATHLKWYGVATVADAVAASLC